MKQWLLRIAPLFLVLLACSGCAPLTSLLPSVQTLTPSGGTFTSDAVITGGSAAILTVPADAVYAPTELTLSAAGSVPTPPNNMTLLAAYSFSTASSTTFVLPATLQITYGANSVLGNNFSNIQMYYLNNGNWQLLNVAPPNAANYSITDTNTTAMGTYAVFAN